MSIAGQIVSPKRSRRRNKKLADHGDSLAYTPEQGTTRQSSIERQFNRDIAFCASPWWATQEPSKLHVQCQRAEGRDRCVRLVPKYYAKLRRVSRDRLVLHCEDCIEWQIHRWLSAIAELEKRPWKAQTDRAVAVVNRLGIDAATAYRLMRRIDEAALLAERLEDTRSEFSRVLDALADRNLGKPIEDLPAETDDGVAAEVRLHELTGFVNTADYTEDEVQSILTMTLTIRELTGELVKGLSPGRLRGKIWRIRQELKSESQHVAKSCYESAAYPL